MPDYQRGKIYKITSGDLTYIGSTTEPTLARRLADHVNSYKRWKAGKRRGCSSYPLIEAGQYEITLIELCPCNTKDELTARERFHIETNICVNKTIPGRTRKEYYQDKPEIIDAVNQKYRDNHKEELAEKSKQWRKDNPEKMKEQNKKYQQENRDKLNAYNRAYYAKQQSNRKTHSETSPHQEHLSQTE